MLTAPMEAWKKSGLQWTDFGISWPNISIYASFAETSAFESILFFPYKILGDYSEVTVIYLSRANFILQKFISN